MHYDEAYEVKGGKHKRKGSKKDSRVYCSKADFDTEDLIGIDLGEDVAFNVTAITEQEGWQMAFRGNDKVWGQP